MNIPFYVRAQMATPIINDPKLCGHLAFLLYRETGDLNHANGAGIPIARNEAGILQCSFAIYEGWQYTSNITLVNQLRTEEVDPAMLKANISSGAKMDKPRERWTKAEKEAFAKDGVIPQVSKKDIIAWGRDAESGGIALMSTYDQIAVPYIWFVGITNNFEELTRLCAKITNFGKLRSAGCGQIADLRVEEGGSTNGIVDRHGNPLRPIPVGLADDSVNRDAVIADVGYAPAYWDQNNRAKCYYRSSHPRNWTLNQIEGELL